jgi:hypothetical protein
MNVFEIGDVSFERFSGCRIEGRLKLRAIDTCNDKHPGTSSVALLLIADIRSRTTESLAVSVNRLHAVLALIDTDPLAVFVWQIGQIGSGPQSVLARVVD